MIRLEFLTNDEDLVALSKAYWALDEHENWQYAKVSSLEGIFSIPHGRVHHFVKQACVAKSLTSFCSICSAPATVKSRLDAEAIARRVNRTEVCSNCQYEEINKRQAARKAEIQARNEVVSAWLFDVGDSPPIKSYATMNLRHAFLLEGLISHTGDACRGREIDAWEKHQTPLCDDLEDCASVYQELYDSGLIFPNSNSPLDAFSVENNKVTSPDVLRVNWILATATEENQFEAISEATAAVLNQADATDLTSLWKWVCLCELRGHFNYCHKRWGFKSQGWTSSIEHNLTRLLQECSLGVAKTVMWISFKNLAAELHSGRFPHRRIYNMLPGKFLRTYFHWQANDWQLSPWIRRSSRESIYTSLLFDQVLGGGTDFYNDLTISGLATCGHPTAAPNLDLAPNNR